MNSLAIYVDSEEQLPYAQQIRKIAQEQNYSDVFILSDKDLCVKDFARISTFYVGFSNIDIVFITLEDFLLYKDVAPAKQIYVATTAQEVLSQQLELNDLKHVRILELCNMTN